MRYKFRSTDIVWTKEQEQILRENHNKITLAEIQKKFFPQLNYSNVKRKTRSMGLIRDKSVIRLPNKNKYNQKFWDVPNLINSYYAGFLSADGCVLVDDKQNPKAISIKISTADECIIDDFIKQINFEGKKLHHLERTPMVILNLHCIENPAQKLKDFYNIIPQKTYRLGPSNLPNNILNLAFIIGYIDGDGSCEVGLDRLNKKYPRISFTSCSLKVLEWIKVVIDRTFPNPNNKHPKISKTKTNCYRYYICGLRAGIIYNYLRKFPIFKLARKWDNPEVLAYIAEKKAQYPEYFIEPDTAELAALMPRKEEYQLPPQISLPPL